MYRGMGTWYGGRAVYLAFPIYSPFSRTEVGKVHIPIDVLRHEDEGVAPRTQVPVRTMGAVIGDTMVGVYG